MLVAHGKARVDGRGLDYTRHDRSAEAVGELKGAFEVVETASDCVDPQMLDRKSNAGVHRVDDPDARESGRSCDDADGFQWLLTSG